MTETIREHRLANYQGFETVEPGGGVKRDWKVVRGNGTLTLSSTELRFERWVPRAEFVIALDCVVSVERGKSHNGKRTFGYPPVKVRFTDTEGERIFGVLVGRSADADAWVEAILAAVAAVQRR